LLRARDGESLIYPDALFNAARHLDSVGALDLTARKLALADAANLQSTGKLFINFAPTWFSTCEAHRVLQRTIRDVDAFGIERSRIVFEITEKDSLHDRESDLRILEAYREAGFGLALDDFGAGYSCLKLLHSLRPDYVKLDGSLLRDVHLDGCKSIIAGKVLEIAHELGVETVAEGIECHGEYSWARNNGADWVQGFFFAVPSFAACFEPVATPHISSDHNSIFRAYTFA
jgi:EAL domain-containing protein (putative c-di-GMP-specific phosphodiesterase class I)